MPELSLMRMAKFGVVLDGWIEARDSIWITPEGEVRVRGQRFEAELRGLLVDSKKAFDGTVMPAFYKPAGFIRPGDGYTGKAATDTFGPILTAQQVEDVVAYLLTLKE